MHLLSLNVGRPRENPWKGLAATGIDKRPVHHSVAVTAPGPKGTGAVGLDGDQAHDVQHHGGADQALYAYAREDLDTWQELLRRRLHNGRSFGENLTTVGVDVNGALIGERWRIGTDVLLEVSCPRIPCATFQGWLGEPGWLKRFIEARRPGAYLRVIGEGSIRAGDPSCSLDSPSRRPSPTKPRRCSATATAAAEARPHRDRRTGGTGRGRSASHLGALR